MDALFANQSLFRLELTNVIASPSSLLPQTKSQQQTQLCALCCTKPRNRKSISRTVLTLVKKRSPMAKSARSSAAEHSRMGPAWSTRLSRKRAMPLPGSHQILLPRDVVAEHETPWWTATKKAEEPALSRPLAANDGPVMWMLRTVMDARICCSCAVSAPSRALRSEYAEVQEILEKRGKGDKVEHLVYSGRTAAENLG